MQIKSLILAAIVAIGATFSTAQPSQAHGDGVALGLGIAGFAVGAALAPRYGYYYVPPPYYYGGYDYFPRKGDGIYYGPQYYGPRYYRPYRYYRPHRRSYRKYHGNHYRHYRRHHRH